MIIPRSMSFFFGLALMIATVCIATAADGPSRPVIEVSASETTQDIRSSLDLKPETQEFLERTMRDHLEALGAVVEALSREDFEKAAGIAHERLGFPKHHQVMQQEQGEKFPPKYQKLAMAHHGAAEELAKVIPSKDMKSIMAHLDRTIKACVACHQAYKE
ncbi:MAG TPA: cytochrome c [Nitrospiria bacterium]|nr:cytochrome c [Nitrospiria bacterium]